MTLLLVDVAIAIGVGTLVATLVGIVEAIKSPYSDDDATE